METKALRIIMIEESYIGKSRMTFGIGYEMSWQQITWILSFVNPIPNFNL